VISRRLLPSFPLYLSSLLAQLQPDVLAPFGASIRVASARVLLGLARDAEVRQVLAGLNLPALLAELAREPLVSGPNAAAAAAAAAGNVPGMVPPQAEFAKLAASLVMQITGSA